MLASAVGRICNPSARGPNRTDCKSVLLPGRTDCKSVLQPDGCKSVLLPDGLQIRPTAASSVCDRHLGKMDSRSLRDLPIGQDGIELRGSRLMQSTPRIAPADTERRAIVVHGIVQGVGFRPFVFGLATRLRLGGFVKNQTGHVHIEVEGKPNSLDCFLAEIVDRPPPLAQIEQLSWEPRSPRGEPGSASSRAMPTQPARSSFRPTWRPARNVSRSCSIRPTAGSVIRSSIAPTAARG